MSTETQSKTTKIIFVNKTQIRVEGDTLTGKQILEQAGFNAAEYDLFLRDGPESKKIGQDDSVSIKNGLRFNAIRREVPYG